MATDYLSALRDYSAGGGKSIEDFLKQHTVAPAAPGDQPTGLAARLAAADQRDRLGLLGAAPVGNVITNRPVTAESDKLAATIAARKSSGGIIVQPASAQPAAAAAAPYALPPRDMAPAFGGATAAGTTSAQRNKTETPWWNKSSFDKGFQSFVNEGEQAAGRAERDKSAIRLNRNTYIPATYNYNRTSSL